MGLFKRSVKVVTKLCLCEEKEAAKVDVDPISGWDV